MPLNRHLRRRNAALDRNAGPLQNGSSSRSNLVASSLAVGALMLTAPQAALAQTVVNAPGTGTCATVGTVATCAGDLSGGVQASGNTITPITTLNVTTTTPIAPPGASVAGVEYVHTTNNATIVDVTVNVDTTGTSGIAASNDSAAGIETRHAGNGDITINSTGNIAFDGTNVGEPDTEAGISVDKGGYLGGSNQSTGDININSVGDISINGSEAVSGIYADHNTGTGNTTIDSTGDIVNAGGNGIYARANNSGGDITITSEGDITAVNVNRSGILARGNTVGSSTVNLQGNSTISGGGGTGAAVTFTAASGSTNILNTSGTTTLSSIGGTAILGSAGNDTINNSGTLNIVAGNKIDLLTGTNVFNNLSGGTFSVTGDIDGLSAFNNAGTTTVATGQTLGATTITQNAGTLTNNGTFNGASVINGGTLIGSGTFNGNLSANSGGTIAPGNSIGTQTVNGNFTLNSGSTLAVEVSAGPTADLVDVNGIVTVNGATLKVDDYGTALKDMDAELIIVKNDGSDAVVGSGFSNIVDNLAFLDPFVSLKGGDGNDIILIFKEQNVVLGTTTFADTPNRIATGKGFDSTDRNDGDVQKILKAFQPLTTDQVQAGIDSLSGEIHASSQFALNSTGLFVSNSVAKALDGLAGDGQAGSTGAAVQALSFTSQQAASRFSAANRALNNSADTGIEDERKFVFSEGLYRNVHIQNDGNGAQTNIYNRGFIAGGGTKLSDNFHAGLGFGYLKSYVDIDALGSQVEADSALINGFARFDQGGFDVTANLGYIYSGIKSTRDIAIGALTAKASADYSANTVFGSAEFSRTILIDQVALRPFVNGAFSITNTNSFTETGAGAANLSVASNTTGLGQVAVGLAASTQFKIKSTLIVPRIELAFDQLLGDVTPTSTATFLPGVSAFGVKGATPGSTRGRLSAGLAAQFAENFTGFVDYQGTFSSNDTEHAFRSGLTLKF